MAIRFGTNYVDNMKWMTLMNGCIFKVITVMWKRRKTNCVIWNDVGTITYKCGWNDVIPANMRRWPNVGLLLGYKT